MSLDNMGTAVTAAGWTGAGYFALRTIQWLCNFLAGRFDARTARVVAMESAIDAKIAGRLRGLEAELEGMQLALDRAYLAASILVVELAIVDPLNTKADQVRALLNRSFKISRADVDAQFDDLLGTIK